GHEGRTDVGERRRGRRRDRPRHRPGPRRRVGPAGDALCDVGAATRPDGRVPASSHLTSVPHRTIAAFDFDGTMTRRDTLVPFLVRVAGRGPVASALAAESPHLAYAATGRGDRDAAKIRVLSRLLAGRDYSGVATVGRTFGAELGGTGISPQ